MRSVERYYKKKLIIHDLLLGEKNSIFFSSIARPFEILSTNNYYSNYSDYQNWLNILHLKLLINIKLGDGRYRRSLPESRLKY